MFNLPANSICRTTNIVGRECDYFFILCLFYVKSIDLYHLRSFLTVFVSFFFIVIVFCEKVVAMENKSNVLLFASFNNSIKSVLRQILEPSISPNPLSKDITNEYVIRRRHLKNY